MRAQMHHAAYGPPGIERRHQLADAIDQDVLVKEGGAAAHRGRDGDGDVVMGIGQHPQIRPGREREERVFHRREIVLGQRIEDVADKEIRRRMPFRKQPALR